MSRLHVRLLGSPGIELDDKPIVVDTRKAIALLAYLVVTRQQHRRDSLAALFWPESEQSRARASLRRTLSSLNTAIGPDWLVTTRETIGFQPAGEFALDLDDFHGKLDFARESGEPAFDELNAAVSLYRDDFMAGFALRDSPPFDDWQYIQADAARRDLIWALDQLTAQCIAKQQWDAAIQHAQRWLGVDQLQEPAHRQLIQIYGAIGDRASAIRQYRECVQLLDSELGVGPLEETTALYQAIMESQPLAPEPASRPRSSQSADAKIAAPFPLVGRSAERDALLARYESIEERGHLIVIEGEAGIGKTRLASELVDYVHARNSPVVSTTCYLGESDLAYGVIGGILRSGRDATDAAESLQNLPPHVRGEVSRLLPELADYASPLPPPLDSPGALDRFYDAVIQTLAAFDVSDAPLLLFLDDLQWADDASMNLLSYLIRRLQRLPVCLLVTWRTEDVSSTHRLRELLARAQRDGVATLLPLNPLTIGDISELVGNAAPDYDAKIVQELYEESEGIPFFAVEYLAHVDEWRQSSEPNWPTPGGVRDLIHSRLHAVGDTGQQLLTTAAVIGRSFDFDLLREVSGRTEMESVETLDQTHEWWPHSRVGCSCTGNDHL